MVSLLINGVYSLREMPEAEGRGGAWGQNKPAWLSWGSMVYVLTFQSNVLSTELSEGACPADKCRSLHERAGRTYRCPVENTVPLR